MLLVNSTCSQRHDPEQNQLKTDFLRLGDGRRDGLSPITKAVLKLLDTQGLTDRGIFSRFRIIVKDLDIGDDGHSAALTLLSRIVATPGEIATAWTVLNNEGLRQITRRGRRDSEALVRLVGAHVHLRRDVPNHAVTAEAYRRWLEESVKTFFVPGLGISLGIGKAWIRLRALGGETGQAASREELDRRLERYHEWERLADSPSRYECLDADQLLAFETRVVVVGGPGAGKSTLVDRMAYRYAIEGKRVLKVRMRAVAQRVEQGHPFGDALLTVATDGSGIALEETRLALSDPQLLLVDGLDEVDPNRQAMTRHLMDWAAGHERCRICVLTRPVGYEAGMLPGFRHVELLPLDPSAVRDHSLTLFLATCRAENVVKKWEAFSRELDQSRGVLRAASLAARNPLLLGFLVRLAIDDEPLAGNRASLYEHIMRLMYATAPGGRLASAQVEESIACRGIDIIGWTLQEGPSRYVREVVDTLTRHLVEEAQLVRLRASRAANRILKFWEERRLLDRLTAGHLHGLVFVHPSLGEYAASRYATALPEKRFRSWLEGIGTSSRWRQVILLAASAGATDIVVSALLKIDRPDDPANSAAAIAAAAVAEAGRCSKRLIKRLVEALKQRLTSNVPVVCVEAAQALLGIKELAADLIGHLAEELHGHSQNWTRVSAIALGLSVRCRQIGVPTIVGFLDEVPSIKQSSPLPGSKEPDEFPPEAFEIQKCAIEHGIDRLFDELGQQRAIEIARGFVGREHIAMGLVDAVKKALVGRDCANALDDIVQSRLEMRWERLGSLRSDEPETAFLEAVISATGHERRPSNLDPNLESFAELAGLLQALEFGELPFDEWGMLADRVDTEALREVIRAGITASGVDPDRLADEASTLLSHRGGGSLEAVHDASEGYHLTAVGEVC